MSLTLSNSESAYPVTPVEPLKASLYDYFRISVYFVYFIFIYNNKFTYDKFKTAKFGFRIFDILYSSFINIVYFLDRHRR